MSTQYILFDLDGTLLPMDQDVFIQSYLNALSHYMEPYGFEPKKFIRTVWKGTGAMIQNDGKITNEAMFWKVFTSVYGDDARKYEPILDEFYHREFPKIQSVCGFNAHAAQTIHQLQALGYTLVLATNPLFPSIATETRMKWAGLTPQDFLLYTTYENSSYCKPNCDYYRSILRHIGADAHKCLMVGNDATEDLIAETLGMKVFLLTDCLINKEQKDLSGYPCGSFDTLMDYIQSM